MHQREINLQLLTDKAFVGLCHSLLLKEHGTIYRPLAEEGSDSGIDGFIEDFSIVYQIKFFKARPRPSTFLRDIDKVANLKELKRWVLLIPENPTKRFYELVRKEKAKRPFDVEVLGKTWILSLLDKYEDITERFFPQIAKETSVQKGIYLTESTAQRQEKILEEIKHEIKSKRLIKTSVERPSDSLTPEHIRDIVDEAKRIEKATSGKHSFAKILAQVKNKYNVDNWYLIKDITYGEIMAWFHRYYHGVVEPLRTPGQIRKSLQGVIKAQQKMLGLTDREYRGLLLETTGKTSTTQMDIAALERVKYRLNILLASKK